ncbi:hypothetical protein GGR53DRAFT_353894 [Hypoxylon sp. FL1150]|nr:hypothetical protein GGR53DRAFT_353894 [Hypoxylon sp. FL1150]
MVRSFNEAQLAILEWYWQNFRYDEARPSKQLSIPIALNCCEVGPLVTSQDVGRYFANRAARESGQPRATPLTDRQREILEDSFDDDPFPYTGTTIVLTYQTKLRPKQVRQWFDNRRKKYRNEGLPLITRNSAEQDMTAAARMWRAYKRDPEGYAKQLWLGTISVRTGAPTGHVATEADIEKWEVFWAAGRGDHDETAVRNDE